MANQPNKYRQLEQFLTKLLLINLGIFALFLIFSGFGLLALKIICATASILAALFGLWILYNMKEILRTRSLWLTCAFSSLALLTIVSLICNYPGP